MRPADLVERRFTATRPNQLWVVDTAQAQASAAEARAGRLCRGTLLSRSQYKPDIDDWGYRDARLPPYGVMTAEDIAAWSRED